MFWPLGLCFLVIIVILAKGPVLQEHLSESPGNNSVYLSLPEGLEGEGTTSTVSAWATHLLRP